MPGVQLWQNRFVKGRRRLRRYIKGKKHNMKLKNMSEAFKDRDILVRCESGNWRVVKWGADGPAVNPYWEGWWISGNKRWKLGETPMGWIDLADLEEN